MLSGNQPSKAVPEIPAPAPIPGSIAAASFRRRISDGEQLGTVLIGVVCGCVLASAGSGRRQGSVLVAWRSCSFLSPRARSRSSGAEHFPAPPIKPPIPFDLVRRLRGLDPSPAATVEEDTCPAPRGPFIAIHFPRAVKPMLLCDSDVPPPGWAARFGRWSVVASGAREPRRHSENDWPLQLPRRLAFEVPQ